MRVVHLAVAMVAVMAAMAVMATTVEVLVEQEISVVIYGVQIRYVNVWEEIFVAAVNQTRKMTMMAVLAALSTVLTVLGTIISVNTVFFTAAAAFLAGIVLTRYGTGAGMIFYIVCATLDFLVNPDKFHVLLYLCLAGYIVLSELTFRLLPIKNDKKKEGVHRGIRFVIFALIYLPLIFFVPRLFVSESILEESWLMPVLLLGGVVGWFLYDIAYGAFKKMFAQHMGKLLS